jgi:formate-dependent nitrite reductase membrane component NrfD
MPKVLRALSTTLLLGSASVLPAQSQVKVDLTTSASHTIWYADPFWLTVGGIAVLIIIVLAIMASREKKTTTTVIR